MSRPTQPRDRRGRFRRRPRPNPWMADLVMKPMLAAAAGHLGGRVAKAATDRAVRTAKRRRK